MNANQIITILEIHRGYPKHCKSTEVKIRPTPLDDLVSMKMIYIKEEEDEPYELTERGKIFVDFIMSAPLPTQTWAMPKIGN